jgi:GNAT superfamily N-acetyltransferase
VDRYGAGVSWQTVDAEASHARGIAEARNAAWRHAYHGHLSDDLLNGLDDETLADSWVAGLAKLDAATDCAMVALRSDGGVAGYVRVGASRDPADSAGTGELMALYVHPDDAGSGAGSALHDAALAWLRSTGCAVAVLWTLEGNTHAQEFYRRRGWVADGGRRERDIGELAVEISMRRAADDR